MKCVKVNDFNPRTPCGVRRTISAGASGSWTNFNPRTPCGVRRVYPSAAAILYRYFNPRTPCGVRRRPGAVDREKQNFNPRTPCGVRPTSRCFAATAKAFQSTHPLRGATGTVSKSDTKGAYFNPRTPCGVRRRAIGATPVMGSISIHAPLAGCDDMKPFFVAAACLFQSTHPLRGATAKAHKKMRHFCAKGINTSSLCAKNAHSVT